MPDVLHSVAILKGTVEGDPIKHLAALGGFEHHLAPLLRARLVQRSDDPEREVTATALGRAFYAQHHLDQAPQGRANGWPCDGVVGAATQALETLTASAEPPAAGAFGESSR